MKTPLKIKVHPVIYEFYYSRYHTDVIEISPNDNFSERIKTILQLQPKRYDKNYKLYPLSSDKYLTLLLPKKFSLGRDKRIYTVSRNYLDVRRQHLLSRELQKFFKEIFHKYVLAYCRARNNERGSQKTAIEDFCIVYDISFTKITYEMLIKSWNRSYEKQYLTKNSKVYKKKNDLLNV